MDLARYYCSIVMIPPDMHLRSQLTSTHTKTQRTTHQGRGSVHGWFGVPVVSITDVSGGVLFMRVTWRWSFFAGMEALVNSLALNHVELRYLPLTPIEGTASSRWFEFEVRGAIYSRHGIRYGFQPTQTLRGLERGPERKWTGMREWGSADKPILTLRRRRHTLTDSVGRMWDRP